MTSLADLRTKFRDEYVKIDPNSKVWSDSVANNYINRSYFQIQKDGNHRRRECQANTTATSVAGTMEYALPSDFLRLRLIRYNGQELGKSDKLALKRENSNFDNQGTPYQYYIYGTNYGLFPTPDAGQTIDIDYLKRLATLTSSQASELPDDFDSAIVEYAKYVAFLSVGKIQEAQIALSDYQFMVNTLVASYIFYDDTNSVF
jgi:hypothetical protein